MSSEELETLRRSRTPTTVVTAKGEVQTNEEAQAYVYDIDLFISVQLLEDTPAVLPLAKLCEEHGYTNEWASVPHPHLTRQANKILCKTENVVPLVVSELLSNSGPSSSSTSPQYFHSLSERSKWRSMLSNQDDKGSLQKTHWRSSTSSREIW